VLSVGAPAVAAPATRRRTHGVRWRSCQPAKGEVQFTSRGEGGESRDADLPSIASCRQQSQNGQLGPAPAVPSRGPSRQYRRADAARDKAVDGTPPRRRMPAPGPAAPATWRQPSNGRLAGASKGNANTAPVNNRSRRRSPAPMFEPADRPARHPGAIAIGFHPRRPGINQ
jgi:hypothetical protein